MIQGPAEFIIRKFYSLLPSGILNRIESFRKRAGITVPHSKNRVFYYSNSIKDLFPQAVSSFKLPESSVVDGSRIVVNTSLIVTVRNEARSVETWFESFGAQSALPAELVICDGGSVDNTVRLIERAFSKWQIDLKGELAPRLVIFKSEGASIATGRNLAIDAASSEIVAATDFGCQLDPNWFERICCPLLVEEEVDLAMGWSEPLTGKYWSRAFAHFLIPKLSRIDPTYFLPSARSVAFRKLLWRDVGRFPEYLSFAGEDSLFAYYCKHFARKVVFVPEAVVRWEMPTSFFKLFKTVFRYAKGDAEGGKLFWSHYLSLLTSFSKIALELSLAFVLWLFSFVLLQPLFLVCALGLVISGVFRGLLFVLRYQPFSSEHLDFKSKIGRFLAAVSMYFAQGLGFLSGLLKRPEVEVARVGSEPLEHLLLEIWPSNSTTKTREVLNRVRSVVVKNLSAGKFVTVLEPEGVSLDLDHPMLEKFRSGHFIEDVWRAKFLVESYQSIRIGDEPVRRFA